MLEFVPILSLGLNIIIVIVSIAGFLKIIKNDLTHVQKDLTEIKDGQLRTDEKLDNLSERVATIEGKLQ